MKKKLRMLGVVFFGVLMLTAPVAFAQGSSLETPARPEGGSGTTFVDGFDYWFFQFEDGDGDFFRAVFEGDASEFISQKPSGDIFFHMNEARASMRMEVAGLRYLSLTPLFGGDQGGMFQASYAANCPVFDPLTPNAECYFGDGLVSINAQAEGYRVIDGAPCTMSVHLTGKYVNDPNQAYCAFGDIRCFEFPNDRNQADISVDCN